MVTISTRYPERVNMGHGHCEMVSDGVCVLRVSATRRFRHLEGNESTVDAIREGEGLGWPPNSLDMYACRGSLTKAMVLEAVSITHGA